MANGGDGCILGGGKKSNSCWKSFVQIGGEILHIWDYRDYIRPLEGFFPTKQYNLMAKRILNSSHVEMNMHTV